MKVLAVAALSFAALIAEQSPTSTTIQTAPVSVTVRQLLASPEVFRNRRVRVEGMVVKGYELFALAAGTDSDYRDSESTIALNTYEDRIVWYAPGWSYEAFKQAEQSGPITRSSPRMAPIDVLRVARVSDTQLTQLHAALDRSPTHTVRAVLDGRFDSSRGGLIVEAADGYIRWSPGFGHLGAYSSEITVEAVEVINSK